MSANPILVSVIIPTRNRKVLLREALESLWQQTLDPARFEIIVVDNRSDDGTAEMLREAQAISPCRLVHHVMPENRGPVRSRNTGAAMMRGSLLALTDSDCRMHTRWLENALAAFEDPELAMLAGAVYHKPEQRPGFFQRSHDPIT